MCKICQIIYNRKVCLIWLEYKCYIVKYKFTTQIALVRERGGGGGGVGGGSTVSASEVSK